MAINLSIKNAPDEVVAALKLRARRNHRSLQGELMAIIEAAAAGGREQHGTNPLAEAAAAQWQARDRTALTEQQARAQAVEHAVALSREGLSLGGRRFARDEMHER
jgi:plasmid stability protein